MRAPLIIFASTIFLAACSDSGDVAAPKSAKANHDAKPVGIEASAFVASAAAKPTSFTTVTQVADAPRFFTANSYGSSVATCPAGSFAVGGGYQLVTGSADVTASGPTPNQSWTASVVTTASSVNVRAFVLCIQ